nr:EndoU domain-containing protein [Listeria immobilis]
MQLQFNQALKEAYQTSKQELEEKLQKLIAFHASSPSIFSEIASLKQAIDQGLAQTKTAWNPTSGTFVVPSQDKLAWANTIRAFQQKKEAQEEPDTTGRTYTRIDLGNGTYIWAWSKDGRTLTQDDIQFTVKHDKWAGKDGGLGKMLAQAEAMKAEAKDFDPVKAIKEIADLFTPIGDGVRVMTGEHPITGDKLSWGERGLSLLFIIPLAKIGKYVAKGFKFVTEGVEDLSKLHKKADKGKKVEKSTKKASGANNFKFGSNSRNHLKNVEAINTKKGVIGGHNMDEFNNALKNQGFKPEDLIVSKKPHPTIDGIYEVEYKIPRKDMAGNVAEPVSYKNIEKPKTVYDPTKISDNQMYEWGQTALNNGEIQSDGRTIIGTSPNGVKFIGYLNDAGEVTNFFPVLN